MAYSIYFLTFHACIKLNYGECVHIFNCNVSNVELCLKVRTTTDEHEQMYECTWAPFNESREQIDWINLAKSQVTFPNMQLHELKEGASMGFFMSTVESMPSTRALLLINVDNTFEVDWKFNPKDGNPSIPTLIVTKKVGAALSELLEVYPRTVEVKVELKEAVTAEEVFKQETTPQNSGKKFDLTIHPHFAHIHM